MITFEKLQMVKKMTICLLDYVCFKEMIAINLCKQQALGTDPEAIQQINFTGNLD